MWHDPLVAEIHETREIIAQAYSNDIHAICEAARRGELSKSPFAKPVSAAKKGVPADHLASASLRRDAG